MREGRARGLRQVQLAKKQIAECHGKAVIRKAREAAKQKNKPMQQSCASTRQAIR